MEISKYSSGYGKTNIYQGLNYEEYHEEDIEYLVNKFKKTSKYIFYNKFYIIISEFQTIFVV